MELLSIMSLDKSCLHEHTSYYEKSRKVQKIIILHGHASYPEKSRKVQKSQEQVQKVIIFFMEIVNIMTSPEKSRKVIIVYEHILHIMKSPEKSRTVQKSQEKPRKVQNSIILLDLFMGH